MSAAKSGIAIGGLSLRLGIKAAWQRVNRETKKAPVQTGALKFYRTDVGVRYFGIRSLTSAFSSFSSFSVIAIFARLNSLSGTSCTMLQLLPVLRMG